MNQYCEWNQEKTVRNYVHAASFSNSTTTRIINIYANSYQQEVAKTTPDNKKWKTSTEITVKTAWPKLSSYLQNQKRY